MTEHDENFGRLNVVTRPRNPHPLVAELDEVRRQAGVSQQHLSRVALGDTSPNTFNNLLRGTCKRGGTLATLDRLAQALGYEIVLRRIGE